MNGRKRVYVEVLAGFKPDGAVTPLVVVWNDGKRFTIDRVVDMRRAASQRCGSAGDRYTVVIGGIERYVYFERACDVSDPTVGRWFVEALD